MNKDNKLVIDPVCGMEVDPATSDITSVYNYKSYHFCTPLCKITFDLEPEKYVSKKGIWSAAQALKQNK